MKCNCVSSLCSILGWKNEHCCFYRPPWWRHKMEKFSSLLAICAGNSPVTVNSPHKGQWCGALIFSLICTWINGWVINREAGNLRRHRAHYYIIVTQRKFLSFFRGHWQFWIRNLAHWRYQILIIWCSEVWKRRSFEACYWNVCLYSGLYVKSYLAVDHRNIISKCLMPTAPSCIDDYSYTTEQSAWGTWISRPYAVDLREQLCYLVVLINLVEL